MKIVTLVARVLLGLLFLYFIPSAMPSGVAGQFVGALVVSHYSHLVFAVQLIAGVLLLVNRFVPLALVLLAGEIANILAFHITMAPEGVAPATVATILWLIVAYDVRAAFKPLLSATVSARNGASRDVKTA